MMVHFSTGGDYFSALNLAKTATADDVKKSFRYYSRIYHPDRAVMTSDRSFTNVQKAYDVLMQPKLMSLCQVHFETEVCHTYHAFWNLYRLVPAYPVIICYSCLILFLTCVDQSTIVWVSD